MKYAERVDLQKVISKLETDNFDSNDIRLILIMLRDYSEYESIFREISHFVAHKNRDQGYFQSRIEGLHCLFQIQLLCQHGFIIDYAQPPLPEVSKAILFKASFVSKDILKKYRVSKQSLVSDIKKYFPVKDIEKNFKLHKSISFYEMIIEIMNEPIIIDAFYNGDELREALIKEIEKNGFNLDIQKVNLNKLLFNLLFVLHGTELDAKLLNKIVGTLNFGILNQNNKDVLNLMGKIRSSHKRPRFPHLNRPDITIENNVEFSFSIVQTDLLASDWCTQNYLSAYEENWASIGKLDTFINEEGLLDIVKKAPVMAHGQS